MAKLTAKLQEQLKVAQRIIKYVREQPEPSVRLLVYQARAQGKLELIQDVLEDIQEDTKIETAVRAKMANRGEL